MSHTTTSPFRVLLVHPGASWSTHDVWVGLREALAVQRDRVTLFDYRLDARLETAKVEAAARAALTGKEYGDADVIYQAAAGAIERALALEVDVVLIVSGMFFPVDVVRLLRRARIKVAALLTESPYDFRHELEYAQACHGIWTNERVTARRLTEAGLTAGYIPHAYRQGFHDVPIDCTDVPRHDVVFVGTGFPERIALLESIDWTGIDLGLYGSWEMLDEASPIRPFVRNSVVSNSEAIRLCKAAKVCLNLYRKGDGYDVGETGFPDTPAESLNPRAYELAAAGCFVLSTWRAEYEQLGIGIHDQCFLGGLWAEAPETAIRFCLDLGEDRRAALAALAHTAIISGGHSWHDRAGLILEDLEALHRAMFADA